MPAYGCMAAFVMSASVCMACDVDLRSTVVAAEVMFACDCMEEAVTFAYGGVACDLLSAVTAAVVMFACDYVAAAAAAGATAVLFASV